MVAEGVGEQHFKPLARGTLEMSLSLIDTYDPDLRKAIFAVFAAMSIIMKDEIVDALPVMIHEIIATLENSDGVVVSISYTFLSVSTYFIHLSDVSKR